MENLIYTSSAATAIELKPEQAWTVYNEIDRISAYDHHKTHRTVIYKFVAFCNSGSTL